MIEDIVITATIGECTDKKVLPRMNDKQIKTARALIRDTCCNYDTTTGGCLLLDRGEVVQCPQMHSGSVCCKYFRDVLLEDKRAKELKAEIMGDDYRKVCTVCGQHFRAVSNRAKYCARCAKEMRRAQTKTAVRKSRGIM